MPTGDEGNALCAAELHDLLHFRGGAGKNHDRRRLAKMRQRVAFVRQELHWLAQDRGITTDGAEPVNHPVVHEGNGTLRDIGS